MHTSKPSSWGPVIYNFQAKGRRFLSPAGGINTSRWPLKAAWCSAVRPALSDTFTLLSRGTRASAQRTALFAAAMWSGVCQFLSLAFTSAECFSNTWTASCEHIRTHLENMNPVIVWTCELPSNREARAYLAAGGHSPVQRSEPLVIFGIYPGTYNWNDGMLEKDKNKSSRVLFSQFWIFNWNNSGL